MKTNGTSHIVHDFYTHKAFTQTLYIFSKKTFIQCDVTFFPIQRVTMNSIQFELNYYYIFFKRYVAK